MLVAVVACGALLCTLVAVRPATAAVDNHERGHTMSANGNTSVNTSYDPRKLNPDNPLRTGKWATYLGPTDQLGAPYAKATGASKKLLAKIALAPRAVWFGQWLSASGIRARTQRYIAAAQQGDRNAIVQISVFSMSPWEGAACKRLPTAAEQRAYYHWTNEFAAGIGTSKVVLILQPDLPFARCLPHHSQLPLRMVAYSAKKLSALPNATVYLDAGSSDWPSQGQGGVKNALSFLIPAGVRYTRGVALNATHYGFTQDQITRGVELVKGLAARGIRGKKVVVNTAANGHPFHFGTMQKLIRTGDPAVCRSVRQKGVCVALGIPPTWNVSAAKWHLSKRSQRNAATYVDGYLWFGRPWLYMQNSPFLLTRALALAKADRY